MGEGNDGFSSLVSLISLWIEKSLFCLALDDCVVMGMFCDEGVRGVVVIVRLIRD